MVSPLSSSQRSLWWLLWFSNLYLLTSDSSTSRSYLDRFPKTAQIHSQEKIVDYKQKKRMLKKRRRREITAVLYMTYF